MKFSFAQVQRKSSASGMSTSKYYRAIEWVIRSLGSWKGINTGDLRKERFKDSETRQNF